MKSGIGRIASGLGVALGLLATGGVASAASLITNGNFSSHTGTSPDSWTVGPGTEILDLTGADYIPCCSATGTSAELANHFAAFGPGNVNNISTLTQSLATTTGKAYVLDFDAGAMGGGTQGFVASVYDAGGTLLATDPLTVTGDNDLGTTFSPYSLSFTALSAGSYVSFNAVGQGDSIDPILDNVAVYAVPEPAAWALMLMGFGGLGAALRSRRRAVAASA